MLWRSNFPIRRSKDEGFDCFSTCVFVIHPHRLLHPISDFISDQLFHDFFILRVRINNVIMLRSAFYSRVVQFLWGGIGWFFQRRGEDKALRRLGDSSFALRKGRSSWALSSFFEIPLFSWKRTPELKSSTRCYLILLFARYMAAVASLLLELDDTGIDAPLKFPCCNFFSDFFL